MPNTELAPSGGTHAFRRRATRLFGVVVRPLQVFLRLEAASGIVLLLAAVAALVWANAHEESYRGVFELPLTVGAGSEVVTFSLRALINDGLMTVFFFVVGMEIKRELVVGELDTPRKALLPAIAALGGMVVPSLLFLAFARGTAAVAGWGIPMATDIAFCIGLLTLLRERVPHSLIVFVTALAIFDDIGGILVIALFYGHGLDAGWLVAAAAIAAVSYGIGRAQVSNGLAYALAGVALWYAIHRSGVHATIAGVVLGLGMPARPARPPREVLRELGAHVAALDAKAPDEALDAAEILAIEDKLEDLAAPVHRFVHTFHPVVAFGLMPVFALANAGVSLHGATAELFGGPVALGAGIGLFAGKQLGVFGATLAAVKLRLAPLPAKGTLSKLYGVSIVAGIGFTVALFIAGLAYPEAPALLEQAKIGILLGSLVSGLVGFLVLRLTRRVR